MNGGNSHCLPVPKGGPGQDGDSLNEQYTISFARHPEVTTQRQDCPVCWHPGFNAPKSESGLTGFHISPRLYFLARNGVFLAPTDIKLCTLVESDDLHIQIGYNGR